MPSQNDSKSNLLSVLELNQIDSGPPRATASDSLLSELAEANAALETAEPPEIIRWATERFAGTLTMATAFGPEGCAILYWLSHISPSTHVFNLETGYQFAETLAVRDRIQATYGISVVLERPDVSVEQYERDNNGPLYRTNPNQCCADRKLAVIHRVLRGFNAWMSGIRRDQSADRSLAPIVGWDNKFGVVKISPLANWTKNQVWELITRENIPYNPLHDQGYTSIGCAPCTRSISFDEDERAGRWSGHTKTECGLHSRDS